MITKENKDVLESTIHGAIRNMDRETVLHPFFRPLMAKALTEFVVNATEKFIAGQKEHGGLITERNLEHEIEMEHLDLFWYHQAKGWQKDKSIQHLLASLKEENGGKK